MSGNLLLVAHGTRDPAGAVVTDAVVARVRAALGVRVEPCYIDVRRPTPTEALAALPGPGVPVPMFLAARRLGRLLRRPGTLDHRAVTELVIARFAAARTALVRTA